ncbi:Large-conductance mechanosensitive channel [Aquisphaera giovannonii]|uniref:Large-conductance mechanosensitive channel n=1 Tax=Aquisphaera giovannonii TaxID=406548 RepID=A0A5B9W8Y1_9BACT|nr:large conductance mechanosensitive channel protein MscL [Aquisphaera giovannonii]QEH37076.1 Large-conductance mechanosensitive channel [Aquisphaera giovannonii]
MDLRQIMPTRHALTLYDEFKAFAFKGNVIDLAVGVIIGGAFSNITKSLVDNVIMPILSVIHPGGRHYEHWAIVLRGQEIRYGRFLGDVVNFLVVSAALFFFIVKLLGWIMREKKIEEAAPPPPTREQEILMEIRDLLKQGVDRSRANAVDPDAPASP